MRVLSWAVAIALSLPVLGCGGKSLIRIDDAVLADVPVEEKSAILAADAERNKALEVQRKAAFDVAQNDRDRSVAEAELVQAKAELDKLEADAKLADVLKDEPGRKAIDQRMNVAKQALKVAEAKRDWLNKRHDLVKNTSEFARADFNAADAKFEFEKAKLAAAKGKTPGKDFNVANYDHQATLAQHDALEAKLELQKREKAVADAERDYQARLADYEKQRAEMPAVPAEMKQ